MAPPIEPLRADDRAAMDGWFALQVRCHAHDAPELPSPCRLSHAHRFSWPGYAHHAWILRDGAEVVAAAHLTLPQRDNRHHGFCGVLVAPSHRRRGHGTRLLRQVVAHATAAGRTQIACEAGTRSPGSEFLRTAGARLAMVEKRRRLTLPPAEPAALDRLAAGTAAASPGYRIVQWVGPTPERRLDDLAVLAGRMSTDQPLGDLTLAPKQFDADRVRTDDAAMAAAGQVPVVSAACAPDGHLAAYTSVLTCAERHHHALQGDTLVAPAHRGRRLGLRIKLANLDLLARERPEVRAIDTFNADDNRWMIAVNEAMGFVPIQDLEAYEFDLARGQAGTTAAISAAASGP